MVAKELRRALGSSGPEVVIDSPLTIKLGHFQANLDRIFAYCSKTPSGCDREVDTYVKGVAQVIKDRDTPPTQQAIRIVVRSAEYLAAAAKSIGKSAPKLQPRLIAGDLYMLPAIDTPRTVQPMPEEFNAKLGLSAAAVLEAGLANMRATLVPLMKVAKVAPPGGIGRISGNYYNSSRLALHDSWAPLVKAHGGMLIVAVPSPDTVLYISEDTPIAIDALQTLVNDVYSRAPAKLSKVLLRWTPGRWQVVDRRPAL